ALRARVDEVLRKSSALATLWKRPLGSRELQAEIDRMLRSSQAPETLDAMFAALDRDPERIGEVIARPALADRLIRAWYAMDPRYHATERRLAEAAWAAATPARLPGLAPRYHVAELDASQWKDLLE